MRYALLIEIDRTLYFFGDALTVRALRRLHLQARKAGFSGRFIIAQQIVVPPPVKSVRSARQALARERLQRPPTALQRRLNERLLATFDTRDKRRTHDAEK